MQDRLIVGLDVANVQRAESLVKTLGDQVNFYKIGHQLAFAGGLELARDLIKSGKKLFLDMKLLDIDNTVAHAVENIAQMNVTMLTIHAYPNAMKAAVQAAKGSDLCLLGVTVLTSMDEQDLANAGYKEGPHSLVLHRSLQAKDLGMHGVVCSAQESHSVRHIIGADMAIVTPGIRLSHHAKGDQKRIMTPAQALKAGSSHLVVARPIIESADPCQSVAEILEDMCNYEKDLH